MGLIREARARLDVLSRDKAARTGRAIAYLETRVPGSAASPERPGAMRALIAKYSGRATAAEMEVDLIASSGARREDWIRPLEEVAARHPGTTAAARALYEKAFQLSSNLSRSNVDPTEPFLEALAIVRDLRSGRYPAGDCVARAPWLATGTLTYTAPPATAVPAPGVTPVGWLDECHPARV